MMDDFEDIRQLWNSNISLEIPKLEHIQNVIKKYQVRKKRNAFLLTILFALCGIAFVWIIILYDPQLWTTTVGEALILLGFLSGLVLKLKTLKKISKNELKSNKEFLEDLGKRYVQKKSKANWHLIISALLLVIGYGFFIYEGVKDDRTEMILSYLGIVLFALVVYFVFRPFTKRNSDRKTQELLKEIEGLK